MQLHPDVPFGNPQHGPNLSRRHFFEVQRDQQPIHRGQTGDTGVESPDGLVRVSFATRAHDRDGGRLLFARPFQQAGAPLFVAQPSEAGVVRDPIHPGAEVRFAPEPIEAFPEVDEHFLVDVLAVRLVADVSAADPVERIPMPLQGRGKLRFLFQCSHLPVRCGSRQGVTDDRAQAASVRMVR